MATQFHPVVGAVLARNSISLEYIIVITSTLEMVRLFCTKTWHAGY